MCEKTLRIRISLFIFLHLWEDSQYRDLKSGCSICGEGFISKDIICEKTLKIWISYLAIAV